MSDSSAESQPLRTAFFVDGFNVYHSLLAAGRLLPGLQLKWLDLPSLLTAVLPLIDKRARLTAVHYFTAYAKHQFPGQVPIPSGKTVAKPATW